jgi:hypothetical protein
VRADVVLEDRDGHESRERPAEGAWDPVLSWLDRNNTLLTVGAGLLCSILYLLYVNHYAVDALQGDDWNMIPLGIHQALHGHFSLGLLWSQYGDSRVPLAKAVIILFALGDGFNTHTVILFNAIAYVAAYGILLALCRAYLGRRLTPIPVLVLGLVWFSLASVQSALWEFLMVDYLLVLGFVVMLFALNVPKTHRTLWFSVGVVAAVVASMSFISGFVVWPLGAISLVWARPRERQTITEFVVWIAAALITTVVYFVGFSRQFTCVPALGCTPNAAFDHPLSGLHFFFVLIGNVIPGGFFGAPYAPQSYLRYDVVGIALCLVAVYVVVQSWRERATTEKFPLPLMLIGFGLLVDVLTTIGRSGEGLFSAINSNRYELPNLILLSGIVLYAWAHLPSRRPRSASHRTWAPLAWLPVLVLAVFLGFQVVTATQFGLTNAPLDRAWIVQGTRLAVNLNELPVHERLCERAAYFIPTPAIIRLAAVDQLGEFQPGVRSYYRKLGLPTLSVNC